MPRNQKKNYSAGPIWDEEVKRWLAEVVYPDDLGSNEPEYRWKVESAPLMVHWTRVRRWRSENLRTAGSAHEGCVKRAV